MSSGGGGATRFLVTNGVPHGEGDGDIPPISAFLETTPGAYTTTRTHCNASVVLFWERHLRRLADSARILAESGPHSPILSRGFPASTSLIRPFVEGSLRTGLGMAMKRRSEGEELAITALVSGRDEEAAGTDAIDVYVHIGFYVPQAFGTGAHLAVVGRGRDIAEAKYSDWARIRKQMEKLRPPLVTELLLSNNGDQILEGSVTNFFVVCCKVSLQAIHNALTHLKYKRPLFVMGSSQEVCSSRGIPVREVAPKWSEREFWQEAFVTSSLRLLQHVEMIQTPKSWGELQTESWKHVSWVEKRFKIPGTVTIEIQRAILERANACGYPTGKFI